MNREPFPDDILWFVRSESDEEGLVHCIAPDLDAWDSGLTMCGESLTWVESVMIPDGGIDLSRICRACLFNVGRCFGGDVHGLTEQSR